MEITNETLRDMYARMIRIREFEERAVSLIEEKRAPGFVCLYVGQEAVAVGVCATLKRDDYITSTHRGNGHLIAKGADIRQMFAELYGKVTGSSKGKGGALHIADPDLGILGTNPIVGAGAPIAAGAAFACKYRGRGQVAVCFFGDGAAAEGATHEAANFAAVNKLPLLLVCENNLYGELMPYAVQHPTLDIADLAAGYGIPGVVVDGMDVLAVHEVAAEAVARARRGEGPSLIECKTYRFYDHVFREWLPGKDPRPPAEVASWRSRDPILHFRNVLLGRGVLTAAEADSIVEQTRAAIEEAVKFAEASPYPDGSALFEDLFVERPAG